jgi:hypothetical protein
MRGIRVVGLVVCALVARPEAQAVRVEDLGGGLYQAMGAGVAAGGPAKVAARALALADTDPVVALYLTDMALAADAAHAASLEARLEALRVLDARSDNSNERGWLAAAIRDAERRLKPREQQ